MIKNVVFKTSAGVILTTLAGILGGWDSALKTLVIIVVIDYITGVLKSIYNKKLSSLVGMKGLIKKVLFFIVVAVAHIVDDLSNANGSIRSLVIYVLIANEGISVLENSAEMGVPVPKKVKDILIQLKGSDNDEASN